MFVKGHQIIFAFFNYFKVSLYTSFFCIHDPTTVFHICLKYLLSLTKFYQILITDFKVFAAAHCIANLICMFSTSFRSPANFFGSLDP